LYRDPIEATILFEELPIGTFFAWKKKLIRRKEDLPEDVPVVNLAELSDDDGM